MTSTTPTGAISQFLRHHFRHFNAAALIDAAEAYRAHLDQGGAMLVTLAGAMSTAELGLSLAEMIRLEKVHAISCTGANLEEDVFNLIAHDFYERVPHYRDLGPAEEQALLERHMNRVTDTCIPEEEALRRLEGALLE
ncbi:MAG: deoxyhypusine synthase family protein, partial [Chloroflexaceae bacterium]